MTLPVSDVVSVSVSVEPQLPTIPVNLGSLVIFGSSARLPFGDRLRYYPSLAAVGSDFNVGDDEYIAADVWFSQSPAPNIIGIARRFVAATSGELIGSVALTGMIATFAVIAAGSFDISIDGHDYTVSAVDFTGAGIAPVASMADVATILQAAIRTHAAGATVSWQNNQFVLCSGTTSVGSSVSYATAAIAGTYLGVLLGWDESQGGPITAGAALETITQSLQNIRNLDQSWYGFFCTPDVEDNTDVEAAAFWAEANFVFYFYTTADGECVNSSSGADIGSILKGYKYTRTCGQWDNNGNLTSAYDILSIAACLLTTDFTQPNSSKILKFRTEPGVATVGVSEDQRRTLEAKNMNYYTSFGDTQMFSPGVTASGRFVDEVYGLDALNLQIQNNVFAFLVGRPNKVAQTDRDLAAIAQQINLACEQFVQNGFLAPGYWNGQNVGEVSNGDFLKKGYYVYIAPISSQTQVQRQSRIAPPITVICCGAGAVQQVTINLTFQR
jgi:hypothetical protein